MLKKLRKKLYYEGLCGHCHRRISDEDTYCRYCGTKNGEGEFLPFKNENGCVYGPPPKERTHSCTRCGYSWSTFEMIDCCRYCPRCGGPITTVCEEKA